MANVKASVPGAAKFFSIILMLFLLSLVLSKRKTKLDFCASINTINTRYDFYFLLYTAVYLRTDFVLDWQHNAFLNDSFNIVCTFALQLYCCGSM